ncbi:MAG: hypothetical protein ACJAWX_002750 [Algoriphagus sp.]
MYGFDKGVKEKSSTSFGVVGFNGGTRLPWVSPMAIERFDLIRGRSIDSISIRFYNHQIEDPEGIELFNNRGCNPWTGEIMIRYGNPEGVEHNSGKFKNPRNRKA